MRRREDARGRSRLRYSFHSVDHPWSDHRAVGAGVLLLSLIPTENSFEQAHLHTVAITGGDNSLRVLGKTTPAVAGAGVRLESPGHQSQLLCDPDGRSPGRPVLRGGTPGC